MPVWPIFDFRFWGKWPLIFENVFPDSAIGHLNTFRDQIWWKSAVAKLPKGRLVYNTKKLALHGSCPSPHFVQNGSIVPQITWTLSPLDMSTCTEFGPDRLRFAGLIPKRLIFRTKSHYNIGIQPTNRSKLYIKVSCKTETRNNSNR